MPRVGRKLKVGRLREISFFIAARGYLLTLEWDSRVKGSVGTPGAGVSLAGVGLRAGC